MEKRKLTCICCPIGCQLEVEISEGKVVNVIGNTCKRGEKYAHDEIMNPKRHITTIVKVRDGNLAMVPVKTKEPIPKDMIMDINSEIHKLILTAPICEGDIVIKNILGTGVDIVATRDVIKKI